MDIMKLAGAICGALVKDYEVYKNGSMSERQYKDFIAPRDHKITTYFSMVRIQIGSLTVEWATAS